eukprot:3831988-Amphidinium_carterae.2
MMTAFSCGRNHLTGLLPESGLEAMRAVSFLYAHTNRLAGALPDKGLRKLGGLELLSIDYNYFEGAK